MPYMKQLIEGYHRFRENGWAHERQRWAELAEGQSPQVMILACADSRSDPAEIFDARPGEMFVARNIAALAPPYETSSGFHGVSAALEFAVTQLECRRNPGDGPRHVRRLRSGAHRRVRRRSAPAKGISSPTGCGCSSGARDTVRARHAELDRGAFLDMEQEAVKVSLANLRTFPWIAEREQAGTLKLHGAHFSISEGRLYVLDEAEGDFRPV